MSKFICFVLCAVVVSLNSVCATLTDEQKASIREAVSPIIDECAVGHDDDLGSCFIGCFFKKLGIVGEDGVYNLDVALNTLNVYLKSIDRLNRFEDTARKCITVNEKPVSAGNEVCERAQMIIECAVEHKPVYTQYEIIAQAVLS